MRRLLPFQRENHHPFVFIAMNIVLFVAFFSFGISTINAAITFPSINAREKIKKQILEEVHTSVNAQRTVAGLSARTFTSLPTGFFKKISVQNLQEARTAISEIYTNKGLPAPTWTDPSLTPGQTVVKAVHFTELQAKLEEVGRLTAGGIQGLPANLDPTAMASDSLGNLFIVDKANGKIWHISPEGTVNVFVEGLISTPLAITAIRQGNETYLYTGSLLTRLPTGLYSQGGGIHRFRLSNKQDDHSKYLTVLGLAINAIAVRGTSTSVPEDLYIANADSYTGERGQVRGQNTLYNVDFPDYKRVMHLVDPAVVGTSPYRLPDPRFFVGEVRSMAFDPVYGHLILNDRHSIRIVIPSSSSGDSYHIAGQAYSPAFVGENIQAGSAFFNEPGGFAFDADGDLYVADKGNHCIRKISRNRSNYFSIKSVVTTVAGTCGTSGSGDLLSNPRSVAFRPDGKLIIADAGNRRVVVRTVNTSRVFLP